MNVVADASALLAIYLGEPEAEQFTDVLLRNESVVSPVNLWESAVRVHGLEGAVGVADLRTALGRLGVSVTPVSEAHAWAAVEAFARFGRRTPAGLNLGDCFAYALAQLSDSALLYKGDDFPLTDVRSAL